MVEFMAAHDETEVCIIQNDYDDPFNTDRVNFFGVYAWPTIVGNGLSDVWPFDCVDGDFAAWAAIPSPLMLEITQDDVSTFTAHITAEENVTDAAFFMVVTLDEYVDGADGQSHLPHHVKLHLTPPSTGAPFTLMAGQTTSITHTFELQPGWDYDDLGVAAWVSRPGGTNVSPCPFGDISIKNETLQSRWVPAGGVVRVENKSWTEIKSLYQ
jgi:hypothetical protein